jgi:hypothetical protein
MVDDFRLGATESVEAEYATQGLQGGGHWERR